MISFRGHMRVSRRLIARSGAGASIPILRRWPAARLRREAGTDRLEDPGDPARTNLERMAASILKSGISAGGVNVAAPVVRWREHHR